MEPIIFHSTMWGKNFMIPMYLFFGGLTAGLGIVAVVADFLEGKNKAYALVSKLAAYAAVPAWLLGSFFVVFHLGRPVRGLFFPLFFSNYGSWMTYGGWAMGVAGPVLVVYLLLRHFDLYAGPRRLLGVLNIPLMLWVALNTAMLLSAARRVPMWDRDFLPALFINSGVLTGMALAGLLFVVVRRFAPSFGGGGVGEPARMLAVGSVVVLAFELIEAGILYGLINNMAAPAAMAETAVMSTRSMADPKAALAVYHEVVSGALAGWFWWGVVVLGIVIPIALGVVELVLRKFEEQLVFAKCACILLGAVLLRFVIVWGGDFRPMPSVAQTVRDVLAMLAG